MKGDVITSIFILLILLMIFLNLSLAEYVARICIIYLSTHVNIYVYMCVCTHLYYGLNAHVSQNSCIEDLNLVGLEMVKPLGGDRLDSDKVTWEGHSCRVSASVK